ncbi:esterase [Hyaloraphidium curvatum]|nr:esterase [Hyaloraphidium curvatum]
MADSSSSGLKVLSENKHFGGVVRKYEHASEACGCAMKFNVFVPPQAASGKVPVLWFLSGLTCTEDNFFQKAGAFRKAAELGIAIIGPDTSPRGVKIEGDDASWDFGVAAGFYVDATNPPWSSNYRMFTYVTQELYSLVSTAPEFASFDTKRMSITGHSMGGHGALICYLKTKEAGKWKSVSAFAPIVNPCSVPWGNKAFTGYLGPDQSAWAQYDATELVKASKSAADLDILIDQGSKDSFMPVNLQPEALEKAVTEKGGKCTLRMQEGYDHSYWFISTFIDDHLQFAYEKLAKL